MNASDETVGGVHWSFWVIGAVTLIYNAAGTMNFFAQMNAEAVAAMPESYRAIIEGRPVWATGAFAVAVIGGALGCVVLLLRKPAAYYLFIVSLLGAIVTMIHTLGVVGSGIAVATGNLVQLVVTAFLIWYTNRARRINWIS
ncbi:MAG: hypothetical protein O7F71_05710 [Gammaproteobacteria bacterium]|nr:hypothetical protein [Gammaproteobacteria bacterium]